MLIYDVLKQDHNKVKDLLARLVASADADEKTRHALIDKIKDELIPHARAEEAVFYNPLREIDGAKESVMHAYAEHAEAETLLHGLRVMDALSMDWRKTAQKLKEAIEHHIEEEETEIFENAKQVLAVEEAEMMARAFEKLKPEVREQSSLKSALDLVANLMPSRFTGIVRSYTHRIN